MEFQELLNVKTDTPFELELKGEEEEDESTQSVLEKVSEFLVIDSASTNNNNIPSTSSPITFLNYSLTHFNTNPPDSWILPTGFNREDFTFVCLWKNCFLHIPNIEELEAHLEEHFKNDFPENIELPTEEELKCPIFGCEMSLESSKHVYCHLRSHCFQAEKQKVGLDFYRRLFPSLIPCGFERTSYLPLEGDPWVCGWKDCKTVFDDLKQFVLHVSSHLNNYGDNEKDETGMFQCFWISGIEHKQCDQKFTQKSFLKAHLKSHHAGDRVCACPYCSTFLANTTKLSDHVHRRQPTTDTPLICVLCQKRFSTNRLLKIHCRKHVKSVKCAYCDVVMDCASAVSKHMKIVHARIRTEKCPDCSQAFGLKTDLQKHIAAIHQAEPQFSCRYCDKKFRWEKQLRGHEKTHSDDYTPTPYLCHKCPMKYKNGSSLSRHFISQHNLPLPAGFNRFQYKKCHDGFYRLQTSRCISKNVVEALPLCMTLSLKACQRLKNIRNFSTSSIRRILSQEFQLNNEWRNRHVALKELNLGGDYEWIAAVQKKFVGGGKASAVDVDAATCLSEESDQLEDILELVYKLRHTENAADLLPSTEYALYRLFLKHNAHEELFKVLNDPINYGVFPNYHVSALLLSHYIKAKNYPAAAKIASILVQQEMFDNKLLNLIAFYSLIKFCELPAEERIFDEIIQKRVVTIDEDDINEDDLRTMKFPFLKNTYFDDHFDIVETNALVGKSLEWFGRELEASLDQGIVFNVQILACLLRENWAQLEKLLSVGIELSSSVVNAVKSHLEGLIAKLPEEGREENEQFKQFSACIAELEASPVSEKPISGVILSKVEEMQQEGEKELMEEQKILFKNWSQERKEFVRLQAERVNLKLKIEEIKSEIQKKHEEKEKLFFFENRVNWEDRAAEKDKLFEEFNLDKKDESITESEYAKTMFEKALKPIQQVSNV